MVALCPISPSERPVFDRLFQLYAHDLSASSGWPISAEGRFEVGEDLLEPYWRAPDHAPYFITKGGALAGFCLVRRAPDDPERWDMGQFFVLRSLRRGQVGAEAFAAALARHPGAWQVRVLPGNLPALRFWRATIAPLGGTEQERSYQGRAMIWLRFDTGAAPG